MKVLYLMGDGFRPEEYFYSKAVVDDAGIEVETAGARRGTIPAREIPGQPQSTESDMSFDDVNLNEYDGIVVPGGSPGWINLMKDERVLELIREAFERGMMAASICSSGAVLAKAGILKGRKATIWPGQDDDIRGGGGIPVKADESYLNETVVVEDGNIITANGPWASEAFGEAIARYLRK